MKTLFKILRGTITSLLFLLLVLAISTQFVFTSVNTQTRKIKDMINSKQVLDNLIDQNLIQDERIRDTAQAFIDGYIDYIFSKRSFPSIQTIKGENLTEDERMLADQILQSLQNKTEKDYKRIVKIRNVSNFITNGSINLLVNISVILVFLFLTISTFNFQKSTKLFGLALAASGFISLIGIKIFISKLFKIDNLILRSFAKSIFDQNFKNHILKLSITYLLTGIIIFLMIFIIERKTENKTN